jgi:hypothetical protein
LKTDLVERFLHLIEFEGLDDGFDLLHGEAFPDVDLYWQVACQS